MAECGRLPLDCRKLPSDYRLVVGLFLLRRWKQVDVCKVLQRSPMTLELPPALATRGIWPIFYLQLLHLHQPNPLLGQTQPKPLPVLIQDENEDENHKEWTIKQIINSKYFGKGRGRRLYYRAIYTGFDIDQLEQQLQEDFKNTKDLISNFYHANPQKLGLSRDFVPNPLQEPLQSSIIIHCHVRANCRQIAADCHYVTKKLLRYLGTSTAG